jgi:hypothetical protein
MMCNPDRDVAAGVSLLLLSAASQRQLRKAGIFGLFFMV